MPTTAVKPPVAIDQLLVHADWLRHLAHRLVNESEAEDLVQETWIAALRSPPVERHPDDDTRPWLGQVLRNLVRSRGRARRVRAAAVPELAAMAEADDRAAVLTPEELLQRATLERDLATLVLQLDEPFRSAILLRYREGRSAVDIGQEAGVPAGTIRSRLHEGVGRLRARLDERHADEGGRARWRALLAPLAAARVGQLTAGGGARPANGGPAVVRHAPTGAVLLAASLAIVLVTIVGWRLLRGDARRDLPGPVTALTRAPGEPPAAPGAAAGVTGQVVDRTGAPIHGAVVTLSNGGLADDGSTATMRITGPDGRFHFDALGPGEYLLTATDARPEAAAAAQTSAFVLARAEAREVTLQLARAGVVLSGVVLDAGGGPVPGARVTAELGYPFESAGVPRRFGTLTGPAGQYRLVLEPREYTVRAQASGYAADQITVPVTRTIRRDLRLQPAAHVSGRVIDRGTGEPLTGARVSLEVDFGQEGQGREVVSDGQGEFHIDDAGAGRYRLVARHRNMLGFGGTVSLVAFQVVTGQEVALQPGVELAGVVRGEDGRSLPGTLIRLYPQETMSRLPPATTSDADGSFRLQALFPGEYQLSAQPAAAGWSIPESRVMLGSRGLQGLRLRAVPAAAVTGIVRGNDGAPAPGVLVRIEGPGRSMDALAVMTSADGRFQLSAPPGEKLVLLAWDPVHGVASAPLSLAIGAVRRIDLRLERGVVIQGVVRLPDGTPVAGASVAVTRQRGTPIYDSTSTADDGRFQLRSLPPGKYAVRALRSGSPWNEWSTETVEPDLLLLTVTEGEQPRDLELVVKPGGRRLGGTVQLTDGTPVSGATVVARPAVGDSWFRAETGAEYRAITGEDGRFLLSDVQEGGFGIVINRGDLPEMKVSGVRSGRTDLRITMQPGASIAGLVRARDGRPVQSFSITLETVVEPGGVRAAPGMPGFAPAPHQVHDPEGRFLLPALDAGTHRLRVRSGSGETATAVVKLAVGVRRQGVALVVQAGPVLFGRVVRHVDGAAIPDVQVMFIVGRASFVTRSASNGTFEMGGLFAGDKVAVEVTGEGRFVPEGKRVAITDDARRIDAGTFRLLEGSDYYDRVVHPGFAGVELESEGPGGPVVTAVQPDAPGALAGVQPGDVLLAVDGQVVAGLGGVTLDYLLARPPGSQLKLRLRGADGGVRTVTLQLESPPGPPR